MRGLIGGVRLEVGRGVVGEGGEEGAGAVVGGDGDSLWYTQTIKDINTGRLSNDDHGRHNGSQVGFWHGADSRPYLAML